MRVYAVLAWDGGWSVLELDVGDVNAVISAVPVAECPDEEHAYRIARLLTDEARESAHVSAE